MQRTARPVADLAASLKLQQSSVFQWTICSCQQYAVYNLFHEMFMQ